MVHRFRFSVEILFDHPAAVSNVPRDVDFVSEDGAALQVHLCEVAVSQRRTLTRLLEVTVVVQPLVAQFGIYSVLTFGSVTVDAYDLGGGRGQHRQGRVQVVARLHVAVGEVRDVVENGARCRLPAVLVVSRLGARFGLVQELDLLVGHGALP